MNSAAPTSLDQTNVKDDEVSGVFFMQPEAIVSRSCPPPKRPACMGDVVGDSKSMLEVFEVVERIAKTECTVLVTGESGTGKELVARAVHAASDRRSGPFVAVNCGAIPENLLESELFGHARGAFTGAHATRAGRIASAEGGTLFLDELGELPLALQVKLLRVLQAREYSPVGDNRTVQANVRVVAATNIDLEGAVRAGTFREDLYYRLNVIHLTMPALRERSDDIPNLVQHFLAVSARRLGQTRVSGVSAGAMQLLAEYAWPGNVRELENTIERALLLCRGTEIEPRDLPARICGLPGEQRPARRLPEIGIDLRGAVESFENDLIRQALERTNWNKKRAALLLGLNRTTLVEMLRRKRIAPRAA